MGNVHPVIPIVEHYVANKYKIPKLFKVSKQNEYLEFTIIFLAKANILFI